MRLKLFLLSLLVSFSFIAIAEHFKVPSGKYSLHSANLYNLKHVLLFDTRSSANREKIIALKEKRYTCKNFPSSKVQCYKYFKDAEDDLELPGSEFKKHTPYFDSNARVDLVSEAELISIFQVDQIVETEAGQNNNYKVYLNHEDGIKRLDIELNGKAHRYSFETPDLLSKIYTKRKKLDRNEHKEYTFFLEFRKEGQ